MEPGGGNLVNQVLANYQTPILPGGGQGFLRLNQFSVDGETIDVRTYSPLLGQFNESPDQQFTLNRTLPPGPIANYEFTGGDFSNPDLVSTDLDRSPLKAVLQEIPLGRFLVP